MAGLLCMSVACKKTEPIVDTCPKGSCCGPPVQTLIYRTTLDNDMADSWGFGLVIQRDNIKYVTTFCYLQQDKFDGQLKATYIDGQPQPFKYRVWGKIYNCDSCPTSSVGDVLYVYIDKIEYQN